VAHKGKAKIKWSGAADKQVRKAAAIGIETAASKLRTLIVKRISVSSRGAGRGTRSPGPNAGPPMKMNPSKPGQPPHRDTGKLAQSINYSSDRSKALATVYTTLLYGVVLERGQTTRSPVVAKRKKTLAFGFNGVWVFPKVAKPKPIKKRPYFISTMSKNRKGLMNIVRNVMAMHGLKSSGKIRFGGK
jgi:hypothetical protein